MKQSDIDSAVQSLRLLEISAPRAPFSVRHIIETMDALMRMRRHYLKEAIRQAMQHPITSHPEGEDWMKVIVTMSGIQAPFVSYVQEKIADEILASGIDFSDFRYSCVEGKYEVAHFLWVKKR